MRFRLSSTVLLAAGLVLGQAAAGQDRLPEPGVDATRDPGPTYFFTRDGQLAGVARRRGQNLLFYGPRGDFLGAGRRFSDTVLFYGATGDVAGAARRPGQPAPAVDIRSQLEIMPDAALGPTLLLDATGTVMGERQDILPSIERSDRQFDSLAPLDLGTYGAGVGAAP
jgi:hypothetical protein